MGVSSRNLQSHNYVPLKVVLLAQLLDLYIVYILNQFIGQNLSWQVVFSFFRVRETSEFHVIPRMILLSVKVDISYTIMIEDDLFFQMVFITILTMHWPYSCFNYALNEFLIMLVILDNYIHGSQHVVLSYTRYILIR